MSGPLTEARDALTAVLVAAFPDVTVYPSPPEAPAGPCMWTMPGTPWAVPKTLTRTEVQLSVILGSPDTSGNADALANLEGRIWTAVRALRAAGLRVDEIEPPRTISYGVGALVSSEIHARIHIED